MDRLDRFLILIIKVSLLVLFITLPQALADEEPGEEFWLSCSGGNLGPIKKALEDHPSWKNARTGNGEACLHLAGIYGHSQVTELLLKNGANPNIRSTWDQGLRMHPLSWNVYGGHVDNVRLLLEYGADPNLDFDSMSENKIPVTVMDIVFQLQGVEEGDDRFTQLDTLLRKFGALTSKELEDKKTNEL
eukprot:scaffold746_cov123-Cylindrotheca_fusiformis.AAC.27